MIDEALTSPQVMTSAGGGVRSPTSMHRFKAAVRSFFTWAERNGIVRENPAGSLTLRRLPRTPPKFLTEAEKRRLLKELRGRASSLAVRDRVIIEVFLGTGIRLQELVDLDIEDVDLDAKHLRVLAKGSVPQVKFLKSTLRSLLRRVTWPSADAGATANAGPCSSPTAGSSSASGRWPGGSSIGSRLPASTRNSVRIRCGIPSPPTSIAGPGTSWWSSGPLGTGTCRPPRSTPTSWTARWRTPSKRL